MVTMTYRLHAGDFKPRDHSRETLSCCECCTFNPQCLHRQDNTSLNLQSEWLVGTASPWQLHTQTPACWYATQMCCRIRSRLSGRSCNTDDVHALTHSKLALWILLPSVERTVISELLDIIGPVVPAKANENSHLPPTTLRSSISTSQPPLLSTSHFLTPPILPSSPPPILPSSPLPLFPPLPLPLSLPLPLPPSFPPFPPFPPLLLPSSPSSLPVLLSTVISYSAILSGTLFPLNSSFSSAIGCTDRTCRSTQGQGSSIQECTDKYPEIQSTL